MNNRGPLSARQRNAIWIAFRWRADTRPLWYVYLGMQVDQRMLNSAFSKGMADPVNWMYAFELAIHDMLSLRLGITQLWPDTKQL